MKIVIDIPEEIYKASQIIDVKYEDTVQIPLEVIANGTPLPKGHGRLIDSDLLNNRLNFIKYNHSTGYQSMRTNLGIGIAIHENLHAPTIIEADIAENEEI